jgi:DNA mismatch repair protein MSH4
LKGFLDVEKTLSNLIVVPTDPQYVQKEQFVNNVLMLKHFVHAISPVCEALGGAQTTLLRHVLDFCHANNINPIIELIDHVINDDVTYAKSPLEMRNQRTYAVRSGVNGFLDVARQAYKEATEDAYNHISELGVAHNLPLEPRFDSSRQFYMRFPASELEEGRLLPPLFTHVVTSKGHKSWIECSTLDLMKSNQKISDAYAEVIGMSKLSRGADKDETSTDWYQAISPSQTSSKQSARAWSFSTRPATVSPYWTWFAIPLICCLHNSPDSV